MLASVLWILLSWKLIDRVQTVKFHKFIPPCPGQSMVLKWNRPQIRDALMKFKVMPDLLITPPRYPVMVEWPEDEAEFGNKILTKHLRFAPSWIEYGCNETDYFTIMMLGLDEPTQTNPVFRQFQYWVVGNVAEYYVEEGECLTQYIAPAPLKFSGVHRIAFIVYRQPLGKVVFYEYPITETEFMDKRGNFSHELFAKKYNFSEPMAINFFITENDSSKKIY